MKKQLKHFTLAFCLCASVAMLGFGGCTDEPEKPQEEVKQTKLLAPEISANDDGIFWTEIANANGYKYKFNDGAWQTVTDRNCAFPETAGKYTFSVIATSATLEESDAQAFSFDVKQATASVAQTDNVLTFTGDKIVYSVNGGEYGKLPEGNVIDFSSAVVGTEYTVEYYTQGGYWQESENAYYVDGAKQTVGLTVSAVLSAPVLTVNNDGTGLTWQAVENGGGYEVNVDGVTTTLSSTDPKAVAFPKTVGAHTVTVKALENGAYKSSVASVYEMATVASSVPQVTYDPTSETIGWDSKYVSSMLSSVGGEYTNVNANQISYTAGLALKNAEYYDELTKTLFLESKELSFAKRETPAISFSKTGAISWNPDDEGSASSYYYSLTVDGAEDEFATMNGKTLDASSFDANEYSLKVYGSAYLDETTTQATLYLPSETAKLTFKVLSAPVLSYTTGKLVWTEEDGVSGYEVMQNGTDWELASGEYEATEFTTYYVRALGNENAGEYAVTSAISSLFFDPTLIETEKTWQMANFHDGKYLDNVGVSLEGNTTSGGKTSIVTVGATAEEQAILAGATNGVLKLTASDATPRNVNTWGNFDGISFNFFKAIDGAKGGKIVVRMYMTSNANRANLGETDDLTDTVGGWVAVKGEGDSWNRIPSDLEGEVTFELNGSNKTMNFWRQKIATDQWVEYVLDIPTDWAGTTLSALSLNFHNNGQEGDAIYIDEITYLDTKLSSLMVEFNSDATKAEEFARGFIAKNGVDLVTDTVNGTEKTVLKAGNVWKSDDGLVVTYDNLELKAGSTVTLTLKATPNGTLGETQSKAGGVYLNGKTDWKANFSAVGDWNTVSFSLATDTSLSSLYIWGYVPDFSYDIYVDSITIEYGAVSLDSKTVNFTDPIASAYNKKAFSYANNRTATLVADDTYGTVLKQSGMWALNGDGTQRGLIVHFADLYFEKGATITVTLKLEGTTEGKPHNWLAAGINGTENTDGVNTLNGVWTAVTINVSAGTTLSSVYLNSTTSAHSFNLYVASIVIVENV